MSLDWRTGAFAAGAAFILSFLAGVIGGVSFGALLVRAIVGSVVFGAGGVGVSLLIERYLPELRTASGDSPANDLEQRPGGRVDITVDDSMDADVDSGFVLDGETDDRTDAGDDGFVAGIAADEVHADGEGGEEHEGDDEEIAVLEEADDPTHPEPPSSSGRLAMELMPHG